MISYFAIATAIALATHLWFERRLVTASALPSRWTACAQRMLAVNVLLLPAALVLCVRAPAAWSSWAVPLGRAAFLDEGFCLLLAAALAARDAIAIPAAGVIRILSSQPDLARRRILVALRATGVAAVGLATGGAVAGRARALAPPEVRRVPLRIAGLPEGLRGLRIAQISDLHVGPTIRGDSVEAVVALVNGLGPDLVVITGDLVDGFVEQLAAEVAALARLRAPLGCFFVTGNHEHLYDAGAWEAHLRDLGVTVLGNAHRVIERAGAKLLLAGVSDESGGHDLDAAVAGAPASDARILLAHRPNAADRAAALGFHVQLSGHLHGGQFFPLTAILGATERHLAGLYDVGGMHLYVNRGAGYWGPPLRLGATQEVTLIELVA